MRMAELVPQQSSNQGWNYTIQESVTKIIKRE